MNLEDRALFYYMKDLESKPELDEEDEDILFALQTKFNCLPFITDEQVEYMGRLQRDVDDGFDLKPEN